MVEDPPANARQKLERPYRLIYLQNRNRDTDIENRHIDTKRESEAWDEMGDWD